MTALTSTHSLPSIPSLPPLEMPDGPFFSSSARPNPPLRTQQSSASIISRDSFLTALSSSPTRTPTLSEPSELSSASSSFPTTIVPVQGLRKSVSVDSFVNYGRESAPRICTRPNRVNTSSALDHPRHLTLATSKDIISDHTQPLFESSRRRGLSVSTTSDSIGEEFNLVREDTALKPNGSFHPGQLVLPSRARRSDSTSSVTSFSGTATLNSRTDTHRLHSSTSLLSMPSKIQTMETGRPRSGSLGVYMSRTTGTQEAQPPTVSTLWRELTVSLSPPGQIGSEVVLAVVGVRGCGKSAIIHKGLKRFSMSESESLSVPSVAPGEPSFRYNICHGKLPPAHNGIERQLHVLEVNTSSLDSESPPSRSFWPPGAPRLDGVILCYDASNRNSFIPVQSLFKRFRALGLSVIILSCKSDLSLDVNPQTALRTLQREDVGLVETSILSDEGRDKIRRAFDWLFRAIERKHSVDPYDRNPASPDFLSAILPWDDSRSNPATPKPSSSISSMKTVAQAQSVTRAISSPLGTQATQSPSVPTSPTRARSTSDLLSEREKSKNKDSQRDPSSIMNLGRSGNLSAGSLHGAKVPVGTALDGVKEGREDPKESKEKELRPAQWATLEELLEKLLFLAVTGDDPAYISHFLLTYRRFASPRSVLLAMQKQMRQLDNPSGDPMFTCFAQMRICQLLETWIRDYPHDFAVRGTAGALSALIRSVMGKTHLLHYGSDFLPFLEVLPNLVDKDASWAMKVEDIADENDEKYKPFEDDDDSSQEAEPSIPGSSLQPVPSEKASSTRATISRERKSSLPLTAKALLMPNVVPTINSGHSGDSAETSPKHLIRDLQKVSQEIFNIPPEDIAQEITRFESQLFLEIEPRHWLQYTLVPGKKEPHMDTVARFNEVSNHIADWVVSLILCHDKPKTRARQIEKLVEVANKLRQLNNYSALRAFVAGINNATFQGDPSMEIFKQRSPDPYKNFQSWDLLLQHIRSHRAYRMALRNTKGACIPALEVHMSDLIRAHEGNADFNPNDPSKIHWGKFSMVGKFINSTTQCQISCRTTPDYNFPERLHIRDLLLRDGLMDTEMQKSRIAPPSETDRFEESYPPVSGNMARDSPNASQAKDPVSFRKFLFR